MNDFTHNALRSVGLAFVVAMLAVPAAFGGSGSGLDRWAANAVRASGAYGSYDPWAYNVLHHAPEVITEHSVGQRPLAQAIAAPAVGTAATVEPTGFSFKDAAIGAAAALGTLFAVAGGLTAHRRRGAQTLA